MPLPHNSSLHKGCTERMTIPDSISALVFQMKHKWLWTIAMELCVLIFLPLMTGYDDTYAGVAFASCASIGFVGAMPLFIREANTMHYAFAIIGGVLSQLWCILVAGFFPVFLWWWLCCVVLVLMMSSGKGRYWCLVVELWCLGAIIGVLTR